jgi:hypothetical protein
MKSLLFTALVALFSFISPAYAGNPSEPQVAKAPIVSASCDTRGRVYGQGCCSWHGGECGCQDGRDRCCDGTLSPSCTCHSAGTQVSEEAELLQFAQQWVNPYVRSDGTPVQGYWRSTPDGDPYNNYSYPGNTNPFTGKVAPGNPDTYLRNYYNRGSDNGYGGFDSGSGSSDSEEESESDGDSD